MSKKNSSVNLKNGFKNFKDLSIVFQNFKSKLDHQNKKNYLVAVSGGPDSLALVALTKAYAFQKKSKFHYVLIDHKIRKKSGQEAKKVKSLLKREKINVEKFSLKSMPELKSWGADRKLIIKPRNLKFSKDILSFELDKGVYATVLINHLVHKT